MDINQTPLDPSQFGSNVPRRDDPNIAKLAAKYLKMRGWQLVGEMPNVKQLVMLAVPHTSNEDGWNAVMGILTLGIDVKHTVKPVKEFTKETFFDMVVFVDWF